MSGDPTLAEIIEALRPFALEGAEWINTPDRYDGLTLLVAEDYHLLHRPTREACFTIGDLKRVFRLLKALEGGAELPDVVIR